MDLAAAIKGQMLGVLMDALGKPAGTPVSGSAQAAAGLSATLALPNLKAGDTVTATIIGRTPTGLPVAELKAPGLQPQSVALRLAGQALPPQATQTGAVLTLRVDQTGREPRLTLTGTAPAPAAAQAAPSQVESAGPNRAIATRDPTTQKVAAQPLLRVSVDLSPPPAPALDSKTQALRQIATDAAARQGSAAPLYSDLAALAARPGAPVSKEARIIIDALLGARVDGEKPVTADLLKQAVQQAGVAQPSPSRLPVPDIKSLLDALKTSLSGQLSPAALESPMRLAAPDAPPPRADAPLTPQRSVTPLLRDDAGAAQVATVISREAEQAKERITLHQIASLPEPRVGTLDAPRPQQMSFELPVAFGQQTAIADFRIEREPPRKTVPGEATDTWGIRFAIDADVMGPVHAHVRLTGQRLSVSLWAENTATHAAFVEAMPKLEAAIASQALDVGELKVFSGKPSEPAHAARSAAGHFLDRRS
jgi:hypothetical protein